MTNGEFIAIVASQVVRIPDRVVRDGWEQLRVRMSHPGLYPLDYGKLNCGQKEKA